MTVRILQGDCRERLRELPDGSAHCCVTSPPYWGLRDYGVDGQIGLEATCARFVEQMVAVFREVRRVLRSDGTCWVNLGDTYATGTSSGRLPTQAGKHGYWENPAISKRINGAGDGLKPKDLCGIPWRVAFALQADGWWLRQDIIWSKPNPMPESVTDRCTKAHEYLFLLSKSERYHYDGEAIAEATDHIGLTWDERKSAGEGPRRIIAQGGLSNIGGSKGTRNKRSVWTIATQPYSEAHFATFPPALIEPCILAGCPMSGTVLDPFFGAGTTGLVCDRLGRNCIGIELNPEYAAMAQARIQGDAPLFAETLPA